MRNAIAQC